jgi:methionyl-tRNA formyltransferase
MARSSRSRCCRSTTCSTCTRRCSRAGEARPRSSARSRRATRRRASRSCVRRPSSTPARSVCSEAIHPDDDYGSLAPRLAALGGELLIETLDTQPPFREQPDQGVTYAEKIEREDRLLDPSLRAGELERRVRALSPHVGAYIELDSGERLGVRRAKLAPGVNSVAPGALRVDDSRLLYGAAQGALELLELHPAGKRPMAAGDWLRGHKRVP